jgi:hypothetical protein
MFAKLLDSRITFDESAHRDCKIGGDVSEKMALMKICRDHGQPLDEYNPQSWARS